MAKRFSATDLWEEDWFLNMPNEYKLFWFYMLSTCDHAGFFKVNLKRFNTTNTVQIKSQKVINFFNKGKKRIRVIREDFWFIEDFICFQYGHHLNIKNNSHRSILNLLNKFNISLNTIRGLREVWNGSETPNEEVKETSGRGVGRGQG